MTDFVPPVGPPPPKLPEGWKAVWNDQYSEWFYVNIYTKKSQWEKPNKPIYPGETPDVPPPSYLPPASGTSLPSTSEKSHLGSNNPFGAGAPSHDISEDERLARQLQDEEDAKARGQSSQGDNRGHADAYYSQQGTPQSGHYSYQQNTYPQGGAYPQNASPYSDPSAQDKGKSKGGLFGKLLGKAGGSHSRPHSYPPQQQYPQSYGRPAYYGQGYPQQQMYAQQPGRRRPGMGAGGAAALGVGGGLLGGALIGSALADAGDHGGDYGGDGGDFGGGDFGGGDF